MRESIRGYNEAIVEDASADGRAAELANQLEAVDGVVSSNDDLRLVLSDPGVPAHNRRGVVSDIFATQVSPDVLAVLTFVVDNGRPAEFADDVNWVVRRDAAVRDGLQPIGPRAAGHRAAVERIDGYASRVLEPLSSDDLSQVEDDLFRFERIISGNEQLLDVLSDRDRSVENRTGLVGDLLADKVHPAAHRLALYATATGRPRDLVDLLKALVERVSLETRRHIAEVRAAVALDSDQESRLANALSRLSGQNVEVRVVTDPSVLGGFVATIGDTVVDASVRRRLDILKDRLSKADTPNTQEQSDG